MTNGNDTAFPIDTNDLSEVKLGLTKREYFAAMAMQGLCASGFGTDKHIQSQTEEVGSNVSEAMAVFSVDIADTLIAELNKATL